MSNLIEKGLFNDSDKFCLVKAWNILDDASDDLYAEDLEDTDEYFRTIEIFKKLGNYLDSFEIDYYDVEIKSVMTDGVTECCGYDFGLDAFGKKKPKFCPMCGKEISDVKLKFRRAKMSNNAELMCQFTGYVCKEEDKNCCKCLTKGQEES